MRLIAVHGTMGTPDGNWFPWLRSWAQEHNVVCVSPRFPTPRGQSLDEWYEALQSTAGKVRSEDILIGFSIGAAFVCRILEHLDEPVKATFLVCPFARQLGNKVFDPYNETFVTAPFDWNLIRARSNHIFAYAGTNDPYVPLSYTKEVCGALGISISLVDNGGHLNSESGFTTAPFLEQDLASVVNGTYTNSPPH